MKPVSVISVVALAAATSAQFFPFHFGGFGGFNFFSRPSSIGAPPNIPTAAPSFEIFPGLATIHLGNPNLPPGSTSTSVATTLTGVKSIIPVVPTGTGLPVTGTTATSTGSTSKSSASSSVSTFSASTGFKNLTATASTSTSTSATTTTSAVSLPTNATAPPSCALDAAQNPNQANDATHRCNWAPGFDINTDPTAAWPITGNTVKYTLTITNGTISPQGDKKIGFLINGQYPGPQITANWGDTLEITVVNQLQTNGTSIHWHGFQQKNSNTQDGVGGLTECPLTPGNSKTYTFVATSYGTTWYHSHFSAQYGDGVLGPIVINGPASSNYDIDLGVVAISDYFPETAFQEAWYSERIGAPTATNYLINGQNAKVDGSAGTRSRFSFTPGKKHLMRIINTSLDNQFKLQIDGHRLTVVQADFVAIQPYQTNELSIAIGQRYDIIVEANQPPGNYWLRALIAGDCANNQNNGQGIANGIVGYSNAPSPNALPTSSLTTTHSNACVDEPITALVPVFTKAVPSSNFASIASTLGVSSNIVTTTNDTVIQWTIGGISMDVDWGNPTLVSAVASQNNNYAATEHVVTLNNANAWTYWVVQNQFFAPHPMHLHGHDFVILGVGTGTFNPSSDVNQLNFNNAPRRDVVTLLASGWAVIAFQADNPGAWLMHCHIAWHVGGGLSLQFLERPGDIPGAYSSYVTGSDFKNTCSNWSKYAATMPFKQSDSGLKRRSLGNDLSVDGVMMKLAGAVTVDEMLPRRLVPSRRRGIERS